MILESKKYCIYQNMLIINSFTIFFVCSTWGGWEPNSLKIKNKNFWFLTFLAKYCERNHIYFYYYLNNNFRFHQKCMVGNPNGGWEPKSSEHLLVTRLCSYAVTHMVLYVQLHPFFFHANLTKVLNRCLGPK